MESPSPIISTQDLNLGYTQPILKKLNLCVQPGEFIAVLGPNGAGKSTLLKTLSGALLPLQGTLKVLNHSPHQDCIGIGYMPQQLLKPELQHLTARTLLSAAIQAHQWGLPYLSAKQKEEIAFALTQIEGNDFADTPFQHCSGGQQRRIMLAQALLGQPKLLLLDEPLANLDFRHQEKFIEILMRLNQAYHTTILMTTHDVNLLTQAISRVLYMANGQAEIGSFQEIVNSKKLSALYQTPMEVIHYQHRYFVVHAETGHVENVCCEHV